MAATGIELEVLQCPNCAGPIDPGLRCTACKAQFVHESGIYNLLPESLEPVKRGEDGVFVDDGNEVRSTLGRPWRRIVRRPELLRFDYEIVDQFRQGRFLELGGETCFASSIFKSVFPGSIVYASDVSPNALRNAAMPTSRLFPKQPDYFVAVDAERIPFKEATFESVFALTMMHHLPHPVRMLDEVHRVLKPGGRFIAVDAAVPRHFQWLFSSIAQSRARRYGIQESLLPYAMWRALVEESVLPLNSLSVYTDPRYQTKPFYALAGRLVNRLPVQLARRLFPVGIMILYDKP